MTVNSMLAALIVLAMAGAFYWLVRSGHLRRLSRGSAINVETAASLGDRRQLVIVAVEGRRLLLGVTATQVTLVTELSGARLPEAPGA